MFFLFPVLIQAHFSPLKYQCPQMIKVYFIIKEMPNEETNLTRPEEEQVGF